MGGSVFETWIAQLEAPVAGARVELLDVPGASAITDEDGDFTIEGVPVGEAVYFALGPSETRLGSILGLHVPPGDVSGLTIGLFARADMDTHLEALRDMNPDVALDGARGVVLVSSSHGGTEIAIDPMPAPGNFYALDQNGDPVLDATASGYSPPIVVFVNLDPADRDVVEIDAQHPTRACDVPLPSPPIRADHISFVSAQCE